MRIRIVRFSRLSLPFCFHTIFTGANQEVRDYSGKKARQYLVSQEAAVSQDTFRSKYRAPLKQRNSKRCKGKKKKGQQQDGAKRKE